MLHFKKYGIIKKLFIINCTITTMYKNLKEKLLAREKWQRALFMLVFVIIKHIVAMLINFILLFQFIHDLWLGRPNDRLLEFSQKLNNYLLQIVNFLTFNVDTKPFPFAD